VCVPWLASWEEKRPMEVMRSKLNLPSAQAPRTDHSHHHHC
jgi:hypothetical protein